MKTIKDWKSFKKVIKKTKRLFFNDKITLKNCRPWNFINWVEKHKLLAIEALQFNGQSCIEINSLWQALYQIFNSVQNCYINPSILDKLLSKPNLEWLPFSNKEFKSAIIKCNNLSTSGPDCIS